MYICITGLMKKYNFNNIKYTLTLFEFYNYLHYLNKKIKLLFIIYYKSLYLKKFFFENYII